MFILDFHSNVLQDFLTTRFSNVLNGVKLDTVDQKLFDLDGVIYTLSTPSEAEARDQLTLSLTVPFWKDLLQFDVVERLNQIYGHYATATPQEGFDYTLFFNKETLAAEPDIAGLVTKISMLKRNAVGAAFSSCFEASSAGKDEPIKVIKYRTEESVYLKAYPDRVTIIFSTTFKDETDIIIGKVFLQEFMAVCKNMGNAPQMKYSPRELPLELKGVPGVRESPKISYASFVLFSRHYVEGPRREETVSLIQYFRDNLHYHIKCSKANLHVRMRAKVDQFLKVLARAKPEPTVVNKKTMSGASFKREV